jgi:GNAT superfamily N-acetyltransferase
MKILQVLDDGLARDFRDLPKSLYASDPNWVCPLDSDIESVFDPRRNNFHSFGTCTRWVVYDKSSRPIGRIAAFVNERKAFKTDPPTGGCGFFECVDDQQVADLLFDQARLWLSTRGIGAMDGPINFGENVMWWGLLIEGFTRPYYGMNYNPPYYQALFENYGFRILYEQISNRIAIDKPFPDRFARIAEWAARRQGVRIEHLRMRDFGKYAQDFMDIYNNAWRHFENFTPVTLETVRENFEKMRPVMDERMVLYAYVNDDPASFLLVLPDTNELIDGLDGRLGLWGKLRFAWNRQTRKHRRMRAVIMGTKEEYRNQGLESALFIRLKEYVLPLGHYEELELSWVGDFNTRMMSIHKATGAEMSKRHATLRFVFDSPDVG